MKATAKRIGNSKNEQIIVDGKTYIKSCLIGKWNFLVVTSGSKYGNTIETKHRDIEAANKSMSNAIESFEKYQKESNKKDIVEFRLLEISRAY
jgi:hypothetical protein